MQLNNKCTFIKFIFVFHVEDIIIKYDKLYIYIYIYIYILKVTLKYLFLLLI